MIQNPIQKTHPERENHADAKEVSWNEPIIIDFMIFNLFLRGTQCEMRIVRLEIRKSDHVMLTLNKST